MEGVELKTKKRVSKVIRCHIVRTLPMYYFFVCVFLCVSFFFLFSLQKKSIVFFFFFFFRLPFSSACLVVRSTRLREKTEQHATKGVVFLFF